MAGSHPFLRGSRPRPRAASLSTMRDARKLFVTGGLERVKIDDSAMQIAPTGDEDEQLAVHEALDRLAAHDARKAELVKLRYFVGLTIAQAAEVLGISEPTAKRDWAYARAWRFREIDRQGS